MQPPFLVELVHLFLTDVEIGHLELVCSLESVAAADAQEVARLAQLQQCAAQALLVLEASRCGWWMFIVEPLEVCVTL